MRPPTQNAAHAVRTAVRFRAFMTTWVCPVLSSMSRVVAGRPVFASEDLGTDTIFILVVAWLCV